MASIVSVLTKKQRRNIRRKFRFELIHIQKDLETAEARLNVFLEARVNYYGPTLLLMIGSYIPFFGILFTGFDIVNAVLCSWFIFHTHWLMKHNYDSLDGPNGRIDFLGEQTRLLEDARNEGVAINDDDPNGQMDWIEKLENSKPPQDHPHYNEIGVIRKKIRKHRERISILLPAVVVFLAVKKLPWLTAAQAAKYSGWTDFFFPEYVQFFFPGCVQWIVALNLSTMQIIGLAMMVVPALILLWMFLTGRRFKKQ